FVLTACYSLACHPDVTHVLVKKRAACWHGLHAQPGREIKSVTAVAFPYPRRMHFLRGMGLSGSPSGRRSGESSFFQFWNVRNARSQGDPQRVQISVHHFPAPQPCKNGRRCDKRAERKKRIPPDFPRRQQASSDSKAQNGRKNDHQTYAFETEQPSQ